MWFHLKVLFLLVAFFYSLSVYLPKFLDVTGEPVKSDLIVSLGGVNGGRIKKTLELYNQGYSKSGFILLTGIDDFDPEMTLFELDWRANYLSKKGVLRDEIIYDHTALNTIDELNVIKKLH